jgi:hypothetical protein
MSSIVRKVDSSIENIPDSVQAAKLAIQESELILECTAQHERNAFIRKFFPDPREQAVIQGEVSIIKSNLECKLRIITKAREAQIQSLTERLNEYLIREKTKIRAETAAFLLMKRNELQTQTDQIFDDFVESMEIKLEKVESMSNPKLREARKVQLDRDIDGFMALQKELMDKFQNIISESV